MDIRLGHLRMFLAAAERGSVTKAAAALFRAQSSVTRAIFELEQALGVDLFERRPQGLLVTSYGAALLVRARRIAAELKRARDEILEAENGSRKAANAAIFSMQVSEQRLRAFVELVASHHMPTVAKHLGISQPAVSASIRGLEASLGLPLFERTAKGMLPTSEGRALAFHVKRALSEIRIARDEIASLQGALVGEVVVGASPLGRALILPRTISRLLTAHPGLRVSVIDAPFEVTVAELRAGDIDFLFGALRPQAMENQLVGEPLFVDELAIVTRPGHPLRSRARPRLEHLKDARWILPRRDTPTRQRLEKMFASRGLQPPLTVIETSDLTMLRELLLQGDMITAISPQQLDHELGTGALSMLPIALPETSRTIGLTYRADGHPSTAATMLMGEIRQYSREFAKAGSGQTASG